MGPSRFLALFVAGSTLSLMAEPANAAHPDPLDVNAPVPPLTYQSAFEVYRPLAEEKIKPWRESNEIARQLGGWSAFAGGKTPKVETPEPRTDSASQPVTPAVKPMPEGAHSGHGRQ